LNVAARLVEDLAHFARHIARELLLAFTDQLSRAKQNLCTLRRGDLTPRVIRVTRSVNRRQPLVG
jgi:hypothetical protein